MADPDLQIRGGGGGGVGSGRHADAEFLRPFGLRASVWFKSNEGTGPPGLSGSPLDRHWLYSRIVSIPCVARDRVKSSDVACVKTRSKWDRLKRS